MVGRVIVGASALFPFSKDSRISVDLMAAAAVRNLAESSSFPKFSIQEAYFGSAKAGGLVGQRALRFAGLATGLPVFNVENACASSGVAFHLAWRAVSAGQIGAALVVGVDRLSELGKGTLPVQETEWDGAVGVTNPAVYAMRAQRYMYETGASAADLANVAVKSRFFGSMNADAHMRERVTEEEVLRSRPIADPLTLLQCSPKSDGAAALLLLHEELANRHGVDGPAVRSSVVKSGRFSMGERDITRPDITERAVEEAYEVAGIGPDDLDVVELHDAFSIAELLYTEELGLTETGGGVDYLRSGKSANLAAGGSPVVNPSGGLLSRGHPIGATGAAQIVECVRQLTGQSGSRQKEGARVALAHVTGGGASGFDNGSCAVTVLSSR